MTENRKSISFNHIIEIASYCIESKTANKPKLIQTVKNGLKSSEEMGTSSLLQSGGRTGGGGLKTRFPLRRRVLRYSLGHRAAHDALSRRLGLLILRPSTARENHAQDSIRDIFIFENIFALIIGVCGIGVYSPILRGVPDGIRLSLLIPLTKM